MIGQYSVLHRSVSGMVIGLALLACSAALVACGGEDAPGAAVPQTAADADVGQSLESNLWKITLTDQPFLMEQFGTGTSSTIGSSEIAQEWDTDVQVANGVFLVAPVQLTNGSDEMRMFSKSAGMVVTDAQGQEIALGKFSIHKTCVYFLADRWGTNENFLVDNPMDGGVTWEGPIIFDVPEGASGFVMSFGESEGSIDLGL